MLYSKKNYSFLVCLLVFYHSRSFDIHSSNGPTMTRLNLMLICFQEEGNWHMQRRRILFFQLETTLPLKEIEIRDRHI